MSENRRETVRAHGPRAGGPGRNTGARPKSIKKTLGRLLSYLNGANRAKFVIVFLCIATSSIVGVLGSLFLRTLIDDFIMPLRDSGSRDFSGLFGAIMIMAGIYLLGTFVTWLLNVLMASLSHQVLKKVRDDMFEHMQRLPIKYFDTHTHGSIMSHYTNDTDTLRQMLTQSIPQIISAVLTVTVVFIAMLRQSLILTLLVMVTTALTTMLSGKLAKRSSAFFVKQQKSLAEVNGYVEEMITGQKVIKVFTHEEKTKAGFYKLNDELRDNATKANVASMMLMPIMANLGNVQYVLVAIVGGLIAIYGKGALTLGTIAAFLQLSRSFNRPISMVSQQAASIVMALAGAERIFNLMDEEPETDEGYVTLVNARHDENGNIVEAEEHTGLWAWKHPHGDGSLTYTELKGDVRMFDVDFAYVEGKNVLNDITLYAEPGQKVAFVGHTGAGKTTITNLINRFYDIADGKIRYDGINVNKIKKADLRRSLGIVLQDVNLFTGTVRDNIRFGKLDATDEEVENAAKLANADWFISRLPEGYDTMLTAGGAELSQGQRQLISIARAAVADPPVMILDEATNSIDTRTEAIVQRGMDSLMEGRTVFVIAHRLSTVQNSDVIMVLDHGSIIERGTHDSLVAEKGAYYQLYTGAVELE